MLLTKFTMESPSTVLQSIRKGDWMISIDLQDAYFLVPMHPDSRKYLRFVFAGKVFQFRALCFGLSTAPQVFTRVFAAVARRLRLASVRVLLYLDDWLVLGQSLEEIRRAKALIFHLAAEMGFVINQKSNLTPSQEVTYLGIRINCLSFWVFQRRNG